MYTTLHALGMVIWVDFLKIYDTALSCQTYIQNCFFT